jgi:hypothetical protein
VDDKRKRIKDKDRDVVDTFMRDEPKNRIDERRKRFDEPRDTRDRYKPTVAPAFATADSSFQLDNLRIMVR